MSDDLSGELIAEDLPMGLKSMLAHKIADLPEDEASWAAELKLDGQRTLAYPNNGQLKLVARRHCHRQHDPQRVGHRSPAGLDRQAGRDRPLSRPQVASLAGRFDSFDYVSYCAFNSPIPDGSAREDFAAVM